MRKFYENYGWSTTAKARTGIAVCDPTEFLRSPVCIIKEKNTLKAIEKTAEKAKELNAELVVVGHPYNMDGSRGERAQKCEFVAGEIEKLRGIKTVLWGRTRAIFRHCRKYAYRKRYIRQKKKRSFRCTPLPQRLFLKAILRGAKITKTKYNFTKQRAYTCITIKNYSRSAV